MSTEYPTVRQGPPRRGLRFVAAGLLAILLLAVLAAVGLRVSSAGSVLRGVEVAGTPVGGMDRAELDATIADLVGARTARELHVSIGDDGVTSTVGDAGYAMDAEGTAEATWSRGRQANPFTALADHIRSFGGPIRINPSITLDDEVLADWAAGVADELTTDPIEADLVFAGTAVEVTEAAPGTQVDAEALAEATREAIEAGGDRVEVEAPGEVVEPVTDPAALTELATAAETAVSAPVVLVGDDADGQTIEISLSPDDIAGVLTVSRNEGHLELSADPAALRAHIPSDTIAALELEPVDAGFELQGTSVVVVEGTDGFRFDADTAADQLVEVATAPGDRRAEIQGQPVEPDLSTADAEALEITEQVSTFTTEFPCCQSRVTNIQRIAELIDGVLIEPGDTFSVNDFVGPRTEEKGFVGGGAIQAGEFVTQIGGGVSQFATTMYNAAYFGGYAIPEFQAHSLYISRYPPGREATLNYPTIDLKVTNNSPHGLWVRTSTTDTSVTVSFYGTTWVEVDTVAGERFNFRAPAEQVRTNPDLAPGSSRVVQGGSGGFDINVTRILRFPDGREEREEVTTVYNAEPRIIEQGPPGAPPDDPPPPDDDGDDPPPPPEDDDGEEPPPGDDDGDDPPPPPPEDDDGEEPPPGDDDGDDPPPPPPGDDDGEEPPPGDDDGSDPPPPPDDG